jgi:hypothetical protein
MKTCIQTTAGGFPLTLKQRGPDNFTITYGLQVRDGLTYDEACLEFGECLFHGLACDGKLDNRTPADIYRERLEARQR